MIEFRKNQRKVVDNWGWHMGYDYVEHRAERWVEFFEFKTEFSDWQEIKTGIFVPGKGYIEHVEEKN